KLAELKADVVIFYDSSKWLNPEIEAIIKESGYPLEDINATSLSEIIEKHKVATFYSALPLSEHAQLPVERKIGTMHGLRFLERPHDEMQRRFRNEPMKSIMVNYLETISPKTVFNKRKKDYAGILDMQLIVVSNHTAYSLRNFFPETAKRNVPVFYSPSTTVEMELNPDKAADYPYFLMVSGNRWDKNTLRAIMAFERLFDAGLLEGIKVHITGLKSLKDIRYKYRHPERFVAMGYVDDDELQRQYRDAYGFIYPSLNEGFGYPPVEAMRFGVPTAASGVCSIPEVCGDAVLYFNPMDIAEISNRILQLTDPDIRKQLHKAGLERYQIVTERQNSDLEKLARYISNI
ncbi:MAG: glycosyltransferase, partial [Muribaculaceae bacterium]|nr:glycosyltransferase [Muribaculaceae bacterium]